MTQVMDDPMAPPAAEDDAPAEDAPVEQPASTAVVQPFRMLLAIVGEPTSDKRLLEDLALREPPLTVYAQTENREGHEGGKIVGRIEYGVEIGAERWGYGMLDAEGEDGTEAIRLIRNSFLRGVSIDAAVESVELDADEQLLRHSGVEVGAVTIVGFPAFRECQIELLDTLPTREEVLAATEAAQPMQIVAGAAPVALERPPASWFANPALDRRRGFHVEASGRVWGHIYGWGECHVGSPAGRCIQVPRGSCSQGIFADLDGRGVLCADGSMAPTGPIVLSADHAALSLGWLRARDHYAHTGLAVADVAVGEDEHGVWVAGAVRPGVTEEHVHALRASAPSGDWRTVAGRLELVAILAVNSPGYPAVAASIENGQVMALIASSAPSDSCACGGTCDTCMAAAPPAGPDLEGAMRRAVDAALAQVPSVRAERLAELDTTMAVAPARPTLADLL